MLRRIWTELEGSPPEGGGDLLSLPERVAQLKASETSYKSLVEVVHEGFIIIRDGRIRFVNERVCEVVGLSREKLYSMDM